MNKCILRLTMKDGRIGEFDASNGIDPIEQDIIDFLVSSRTQVTEWIKWLVI